MTDKNSHKKSRKSSPSETIEKDQDDLMSTLESIKGLLEQSEGKLNAARKSISIANANTLHDTSALLHMRNTEEEIVPILDQIVEPELSMDSLPNIPELSSTVSTAHNKPPLKTEAAIQTPAAATPNKETRAKDKLAILTKKNLLIDALDDMQTDLEQSLREELMKTMVALEKDLKNKISQKIKKMKDEILQ